MPDSPNELSNPATAPEPDNYGLPANFVPIDVPPIIPSNTAGQQPNPFGGGSLPQNMALQPDFVGTLYRNGVVPTVRLMPVQGAPATNAQSQSVAEKVVTEVINNTTNTSGEFVSLQTNSIINAEQDLLNLSSGTNTVVTYTGAGAVSFTTPNMVGDSGSGGVAGCVPAPPAGSAASGKYLKADGTFSVPPGTGGAAFYQTVEQAGTPKPQEGTLNFLAPFVATDNSGNGSTDISASFPGISAFTNKDLGSTVSLSAGVANTVDSISVTFPSSGGPWYARVSYFYSMSGGVNWIAGAYDGTTRFAGAQGTTTANIAGAGASGLAPGTYANSAVVTFSVVILNTGNSTVETSGSGVGLGVPSYMQVEVIAS